MKKLNLRLTFTVLLTVLFTALLGLHQNFAQAQSQFEAPPGFQIQKVHQAFSGTDTEFDWVKVYNSSVAFLLYDMSQNSNFRPKVQKKYDRNLEKYSAKLQEYSITIPKFNSWLLAGGVDTLDQSLKESPVQFVIDPMSDLTETNACFTSRHKEPHALSDWWIDVWMEPIDDVDYLAGYTPVMIHELGHFVFHSLLDSRKLLPADHGFVTFTLGALDEGFADAVSYAFTGEVMVGKRFEYSKNEVVEFRRALSSTPSERQAVRTGTWNYREGDPHIQGEAFRDVLIEIAQQYGTRALFDAVKVMQKELLAPDSLVLDYHSTGAQENVLFNQVIPKAFAPYPLK